MDLKMKRLVFMYLILTMLIVNHLDGFHQIKTIINGSAMFVFALLLIIEVYEKLKIKKISKNG